MNDLRLPKMLALLASDKEGEVIAAANRIRHVLAQTDNTFQDLQLPDWRVEANSWLMSTLVEECRDEISRLNAVNADLRLKNIELRVDRLPNRMKKKT